MNGKAGNGRSHRASILLVDDDSRMRNLRAVVLSTHGYDVDSASNAVEAQSAWGATRPDLVLVAFSRYRAGTLEFLERIKRLRPQQRIAFVNSESLHLSPFFYNGELIRKAEGPADLLEQVRGSVGGALSFRRRPHVNRLHDGGIPDGQVPDEASLHR